MGVSDSKPEVWLRGALEGVPAELQPVAHCLLQAYEEITTSLAEFPLGLLWKKPGGVASVGFHLQHIPGVLDRLFTYADGRTLSADQLKYLSLEGIENSDLEVLTLFERLQSQLNHCLEVLKNTNPSTLAESREVGRKKLPSTKLGLLFHAAEHTMRHTGQLLVTARILLAESAGQ